MSRRKAGWLSYWKKPPKSRGRPRRRSLSFQPLESRLALVTYTEVDFTDPDTQNLERQLYADGFHFMTCLTTPAGTVVVRGRPDLHDPDGFGTSDLLNPYIAGNGVDATSGSITSAQARLNDIRIDATGFISTVGGYGGSWAFTGFATYDSANQRGQLDGNMQINLAVSAGELNLGRMASNFLFNHTLTTGYQGNTGDARRALFTYGSDSPTGTLSFVPDPFNGGNATYPNDLTSNLTLTLEGTVNYSDPNKFVIRKPTCERTITSSDTNVKMHAGSQWDVAKQQFNQDNWGSTAIVSLQASTPSSLSFHYTSVWTPPVVDSLGVGFVEAELMSPGGAGAPTSDGYAFDMTGAGPISGSVTLTAGTYKVYGIAYAVDSQNVGAQLQLNVGGMPAGAATIAVANQVYTGYELGTAQVSGGATNVTVSLANPNGQRHLVLDKILFSRVIEATAGDDSIVVDVSNPATAVVTINGTSQQFMTSALSSILIDSNGGADVVVVVASSLYDESLLAGMRGSLVSKLYAVNIDRVNAKFLFGDSSDVAVSNDVGGVHVLYQFPTYSLLLDPQGSFYNEAVNFGAFTGNGAGNDDSLFVFGDSNNQTYACSPTQSSMTVGGVPHIGSGFKNVYAYAQGGPDAATFTGTSGDETFTALAMYSFVASGSFLQYLDNFSQVTVNAGGGANDIAVMYDSSGNDTFTSDLNTASFSGVGFHNVANGFDKVYAYQYFGGSDTANLLGSSGDDTLYGDPISTSITSTGFLQQAIGFSQVIANAGAGNDTAVLIDSTGNDTLNASGSSATLVFSGGHQAQAAAFDAVYAQGYNGGSNTKNVTNPLAFTLVFDGTWI